jgi:hypothetical protein
MLQRRVLFVILIIFSAGCKKPDQYPNEPVIVYKDIYSTRNSLGFDQKLTIVLNFTDGDGDVGYRDIGKNGATYDDPSSPYYNNYVATYYKYTNGAWVEFPTIVPAGGRLPYLTPVGKNKTLKGEIQCDVDVPLNADEDTFRIDIFIYDRALHKSNIVTTSDFILNTQ